MANYKKKMKFKWPPKECLQNLSKYNMAAKNTVLEAFVQTCGYLKSHSRVIFMSMFVDGY